MLVTLTRQQPPSKTIISVKDGRLSLELFLLVASAEHDSPLTIPAILVNLAKELVKEPQGLN